MSDTPSVETLKRRPRRPPRRANGGDRIKASPLARRIARERGIDLAGLAGTGPDGRIVAEDVERAGGSEPAAAAPMAAAAPVAAAAPADVERVELTTLRKTIARRMTEAWTAPAFQISMSADMSRAQELARTAGRAASRGAADGHRHPDQGLRGRADAPPRGERAVCGRRDRADSRRRTSASRSPPSAGLVVPVIAGCERHTVAEIAAARIDLVTRARDGKLQAADLEGGTFTISNLGMFGVEQFIAVLNPPQAAILAVGAIEDRAGRGRRRGGGPADDDDDADLRPPHDRWRCGRGLPQNCEGVPGGARPDVMSRRLDGGDQERRCRLGRRRSGSLRTRHLGQA